MIPGKEKKLYYVKDTRSRLFCEAYFILRDGADMNRVCEGDLATEADRLLREKFPEGRWRRFRKPTAREVRSFFVGIFLGGCTVAAVLLL